MEDPAREYEHRDLLQVVQAIGGHYELTREGLLPVAGRQVLYLIGHAVYDSTCCGAGGCSFALVIGFVRKWKERENAQGFPVSEVAPILHPAEQQQIRRLIEERETVSQVNFR
jgi:hypothetical protein